MNKVVARLANGRVLKGTTADFAPNKKTFHLAELGAAPGAELTEIRVASLKALFFVRDFAGDSTHVEANEFATPPVGRALRVTFADGEVLLGTTTGYQPSRPGFFLVPADRASNMERAYIVTAATRDVTFV